MDPTLFTSLPQLGFAGFCAILLYMNWRVQERMAKRLDEQTDTMLRVVCENSAAYTKQTEALRSRPCLKNALPNGAKG